MTTNQTHNQSCCDVNATHLAPFNVTINHWTNTIVGSDGNPDFFCIALLGDLFGWFRNLPNNKVSRSNNKLPYLKGNQLVVSYDYLVDRFKVSREKIRKGFVRLEGLGVLFRKVKNIKRSDGSRVNQLYLTIDKDFYASCFRNPDIDVRANDDFDGGTGNDDLNHGHPANLNHGYPIRKKEYKEKDRSTKSNFCKNSFEEDFQQENEVEDGMANKADQIKEVFRNAKELKDFYPLNKEDCSILQANSRREFSLNAMNEILLDMSKRLVDRVFYSKKGFMNYMSKVFAWEKRDAVKTSDESFKIRNNHTKEEISLKEKERFLTEIEYNLQVSPEWHLKKRLACVFDTEKSYELMKAYKSSNRAGGVFEIHLNKPVDLTSLERETILSQVKATHEKIDFDDEEFGLIEKLEIIMPDKPCQKERYRGSNVESITQLPDNIWGRVRSVLMSKYGEATDRNWFSKLEAMVDEDRKTIELKSPNGFVYDWIRQNYFECVENIFEQQKYKVAFD